MSPGHTDPFSAAPSTNRDDSKPYEDVNLVVLEGKVGAEVELKRATTDVQYIKFPLVTSTSQGKNTAWHRITIFGEMAEEWAPALEVGVRVKITGSLRYSSYLRKDEAFKRISAEIIPETISLLT